MLKSLRLTTALCALVAIQSALPVIATPQQQQPNTLKEVYIGRFSYDPYTRDVYVLPSTIKVRGNLRRFQKHYIYHQEQESGVQKYKYQQSFVSWAANCREGSIGVQKSDHFDAQGKKVGSLLMDLELKVPEPESISEKALDFVCDYRN